MGKMKRKLHIRRFRELPQIKTKYFFRKSAKICGFISLLFFQVSIGYGAEEHAAHHAAEFKPLTEAFRIINFLVVFGTLYYLLSKRIRIFFANRREEIIKSLNEAERLKLSAEKRLAEWEPKIKDMKN